MLDLCTYSFEEITPAIAEQWLLKNNDNRRLRRPYVEELAAAIKRGEWQPNNGEVISFDEEGNLLSGQHRLHAVILANRAIWTHVVRGIPASAKLTIDTGRKRTAGDVLGYLGHNYATALGASIRVVKLLRETPGPFMLQRSGGITNVEAFEILRAHPEIEDSVALAVNWAKPVPAMTASKIAGLHHHFAEHNPEDAMVFFDRLASGASLTTNDPILVLRNALANQGSSRAKVRQESLMAWTIIAFNKWREGEDVKLLRFTSKSPWPVAKSQEWDRRGISREEYLTGRKPVLSAVTQEILEKIKEANEKVIAQNADQTDGTTMRSTQPLTV